MGMPEADIEINDALVARLIEAQHPDLAGPLTLVANGWDNACIGSATTGACGCLDVRLPSRSSCTNGAGCRRSPEPGCRHPVPVRAGEPSDEYPWPWSIAPWFDGMLARGHTAGIPLCLGRRAG